MPRFTVCMLLATAAPGLWAQSAVKNVAASAALSVPAKPAAGGSTLRTKQVSFYKEKPVLGMPLGSSKPVAHCLSDNTVFFDSEDATPASSQLISISTDGSVKRILRKLPYDFTNVSVLDFFASDGMLVTLLKAVHDGHERQPEFFVSTSDRDGDLANLVRIDVRFRPLKVARFGGGDLLMLGWDEGNLQPQLVMLKEDGTIRRFFEMEEQRHSDGQGAGTAVKHEALTLESYQGAEFVPYGSEVMLTYPRTSKPIQVLTGVGESRTIPIRVPGDYEVHDVLASAGLRGSVVVRVQEKAKPGTEGEKQAPKMRLFEIDPGPGAGAGALLDEITFPKPQVADVTCAGNSSLSALFFDTIPDANQSSNSGTADGTAPQPTQLVVATARR